MRKFVILILLLTTIFSCQEKLGKDIKVKYTYIKNGEHPPDSRSDRRDGTVVLAFASNFDHDTINLKYGRIDTTCYLTTDDIVGDAGLVILGKIKKGKSVKLKLNRYNPIDIKTDEINQIFVVQYMDTLLMIRSVFSLVGGR